jgi:prevent-host-death family protein
MATQVPKPTTHIQVQEAKARFSEMIERAQAGQTIIVTRHNKEAVVILDIEVYRELIRPKKSLLEVLRSSPEDLTRLIPERERTPQAPRMVLEALPFGKED